MKNVLYFVHQSSYKMNGETYKVKTNVQEENYFAKLLSDMNIGN